MRTDHQSDCSREKFPAARCLDAASFSPGRLHRGWLLLLTTLFAASVPGSQAQPILSAPAIETVLPFTIPAPKNFDRASAEFWQLTEIGRDTKPIPATTVPALNRDGTFSTTHFEIVASIPPGAGNGTRRFSLRPLKPGTGFETRLRMAAVDDKSFGIWEGERPVLVYNHGILSRPGVPADRNRGTYIHPLHGLDGEVLTDDFPKDHYHHRGLFWAWPHVGIDGKKADLWMLRGVRQQFERWWHKQDGTVAVLAVENGWYIAERKIMRERLRLIVHPASGDEQALDLEFTWIPVDAPVTLAGAEGKSYGGLTLRYAPREATVITTPGGNTSQDLYMTPLPWADLSARFSGASQASGAAVFIAPDHPDFPPMWLTRHYGVLCVGWPGIEPATFAPGEPVRARYRVWIHRGVPDGARLKQAYHSYEAAGKMQWSSSAE
jgi:hypothetical protein